MHYYQESDLTLSNSFIAKVNCLKFILGQIALAQLIKQSTNYHKYEGLNPAAT
jgi:hypothetical protein